MNGLKKVLGMRVGKLERYSLGIGVLTDLKEEYRIYLFVDNLS